MNHQTLSHVTLQTLANCRTAANQAVAAYRWGSHRLVGAVNRTLEHSVYPRTARLAPLATRRLDGVRGNVSDVVVKGIDQFAERTGQAIELGSSAAATQVHNVARLAAKVENDIVASGLQAAARLTLPGAKVALVVSGKVADGATALANAAGARPVRKATKAAKAARKSAGATVGQTAGKTAGQTASKTVRQNATKVQRQVAPVARRARSAVAVASQRVARAAKKAVAPAAKAAPVQRAGRAVKKAASATA